MITKSELFENILSGEHQIQNAIDLCQITEKTKQIIIVIDRELDNSTLKNIILGLPKLSVNQDTINRYKLDNAIDPCREIISRGVRMVVDYE